MKAYLVSAIYVGDSPPNTQTLTWGEQNSEVIESCYQELWEESPERLLNLLKERNDAER